MVEVVVTAEFRAWYEALSERDQEPIVHGVKQAGNKRFYEEMIPRAERLWDEYVAEVSKPTGRTS